MGPGRSGNSPEEFPRGSVLDGLKFPGGGPEIRGRDPDT